MKPVWVKGDEDGLSPFTKHLAMHVIGRDLYHLVPAEPFANEALCGVRCDPDTQSEYFGEEGKRVCGKCYCSCEENHEAQIRHDSENLR